MVAKAMSDQSEHQRHTMSCSPVRLEEVRVDLEVANLGAEERDIRSGIGVSDLVVVTIDRRGFGRLRHDEVL
jgi:hypothetical protein